MTSDALIPLDEAALRRSPDEARRRKVHTTVAVRMADGQEWMIPKAHIVFCCDHTAPDGWSPGYSFGHEYDLMMEAIDAAVEAGGGHPLVAAEMRVFRYLIDANYDIDTASLGRILTLDYSSDPDPALDAMRRSLFALATARNPADLLPKAETVETPEAA